MAEEAAVEEVRRQEACAANVAFAAARKAAAEAATLPGWLRDACKIDDAEELSEIVDAFVDPK